MKVFRKIKYILMTTILAIISFLSLKFLKRKRLDKNIKNVQKHQLGIMKKIKMLQINKQLSVKRTRELKKRLIEIKQNKNIKNDDDPVRFLRKFIDED